MLMDLIPQLFSRQPRQRTIGKEGFSMGRRRFSTVAVAAAGVIAIWWAAQATPVAAAEDYRLSGPYTHDGLAIYLIHREDTDRARVPLTLEEAMQRGVVKVLETGNVNELVVRNLGGREVFIQAGDIVKGGKQDRVLTISMLLQAKSGDIPIGAFCVEHGRWARRGHETATEFSESTERAPSKAIAQAIAERMRREMDPLPMGERTERSEEGRQQPEGESLQSRVWNAVQGMQVLLDNSIPSYSADERSPSSLQLSLENTALGSTLEGYRATLGNLPQEHEGAVGYVFAINGEINSGDEFSSSGLFHKLWPRQLKAASTQAIASGDVAMRDQPTLAQVAGFIDSVRAGEWMAKSMPGGMSLEMRETDKALFTEMRDRDGRWVHRSYLVYQ